MRTAESGQLTVDRLAQLPSVLEPPLLCNLGLPALSVEWDDVAAHAFLSQSSARGRARLGDGHRRRDTFVLSGNLPRYSGHLRRSTQPLETITFDREDRSARTCLDQLELDVRNTAQKQQNTTNRCELPTTIPVFRSCRAHTYALRWPWISPLVLQGWLQRALASAPEKQRQIGRRQIVIHVVALVMLPSGVSSRSTGCCEAVTSACGMHSAGISVGSVGCGCCSVP